MSRRWDRLLCLVGAAMLGGLAAIMAWRIVSFEAAYLKVPSMIVVGLALLFFIGACLPGGRWQRFIRGCSILMINTAIVFGLAEGVCRVTRVDFNEVLGARQKNEAFPIYFRLPTKQVGDVFFTRKGPDQWTGKPLSTLLQINRGTDEAYTDESEVTIRYDKDGFRNPDDLRDWDMVIVGDSFTESGYLPPEQIFTGLVAAQTGKKVKNLGLSDTGNFSHIYFLKTYGKAPSCRTAVMVFFEGNDITDNLEETEALKTFRATGERPSHDIPVEPSLIKTLYHFARDFRQMNLQPRSYANASFKAADGKKIPVTIADAPPGSAQMSAEEKKALAEALTAWGETCKAAKVEPWLLYLPCKRRVLHEQLVQGQDYPEPEWQLNDLPALIQKECVARGIAFVDSTPSLMQKSKAGINTFNTIYDTHLNTEGHRVVAKVLADALVKPATEIASAPPPPPPPAPKTADIEEVRRAAPVEPDGQQALDATPSSR